MKTIQTIASLIDAIKIVISMGKTPVFDYDQVLYDQGVVNTELINAIEEMDIELKIASHGCAMESTCPLPYTEIEHKVEIVYDDDGLPALDNNDRPIMAKDMSDEYVLIDDRATEWASITGKDNYIQYAFTV